MKLGINTGRGYVEDYTEKGNEVGFGHNAYIYSCVKFSNNKN